MHADGLFAVERQPDRPAGQPCQERGLRPASVLGVRVATQLVADGRVTLDGASYVWEADEMLCLVGEASWPDDRAPRVAAERERVRFLVA